VPDEWARSVSDRKKRERRACGNWAVGRGSAHAVDREEEMGCALRRQAEAALGRIPIEDEFPFLFLFLIFQSNFSKDF
jgi:hypothetical protein